LRAVCRQLTLPIRTEPGYMTRRRELLVVRGAGVGFWLDAYPDFSSEILPLEKQAAVLRRS
jgi:hypothetical protein